MWSTGSCEIQPFRADVTIRVEVWDSAWPHEGIRLDRACESRDTWLYASFGRHWLMPACGEVAIAFRGEWANSRPMPERGISMTTRVVGRRSGLVIIAAFLIGPSLLFAQVSAGTGAITGVVTDASGGVLPGVELTVRSVATNVARTAITNEVGRYEVVAL